MRPIDRGVLNGFLFLWYIGCREYQANVLRTARMFLQLGLEQHHSVGVLAFNSPEWFYSCLGAVHAG